MKNEKSTDSNIWAATATTLIYFALLLALLLFVSFTLSVPVAEHKLIMLDFGGLSGAGSGEEGGHPSDEILSGQPVQSVDDSDVPLFTQNDEPAPTVTPPSPQSKPHPKVRPTQPATEPAREVDRQSLFPGSSTTPPSSATTVGGGTGTGGPGGGTGSEGTGPGSGSSGSFTLEGRGLVGSLPKPDYSANVSGRVGITITVSSDGSVINATFRPTGSTTQDSQLVAEAIKAARKARFTPSQVGENQMGTITYLFKLQ